MELTELVRSKRCSPDRTWNIASSEHWYNGDDFWIEMITSDPVYREAMIEAEAKLIHKICDDLRDSQKDGLFVALGPGDSKKESELRTALGTPIYVPIDVNENELALVAKSVRGEVRPIRAEFREGLRSVRQEKPKFIYLGSTYSNLDAIQYDLLGSIDESMHSGDSAYVSVQTLPCMANLPLYLHEYKTVQHMSVNKRMANTIGAEVSSSFIQFNPTTKNIEIGSIVSAVSGTAREVGMLPGDKVVTLLSHKPESLTPELQQRFGSRYAMKSYSVQHKVPIQAYNYISTFEGVVMTKK